jgi:tRNA (adenine57-N1/adenine58-N1)-methyltransferase
MKREGRRKSKLPAWLSAPLLAGAFAALAWLERRRPLRLGAVEPKLRREARNLTVAGAGALALQLAEAPVAAPLARLVERRADFADVARANVGSFFGEVPGNWALRLGDLAQHPAEEVVDRVVLDMLEPWAVLPAVAAALRPGGVLIGYVATTTQLSSYVEALRAQGVWTEPHAWETLLRPWHAVGLAVRPEHRMVAHTAFLVTARRLAEGAVAPARQRRPQKR